MGLTAAQRLQSLYWNLILSLSLEYSLSEFLCMYSSIYILLLWI